MIADAVTSLLAKLPEEEKMKVNQIQAANEIKEKLQEKIAVIVEPAFSGECTRLKLEFVLNSLYLQHSRKVENSYLLT